ncbi:hypothetical protein LJC17_04145 [Acholeplasma sp. OttesenSCG-928-E16]|nr:hypothetical protein [Acholeplasma sp. OttesenSCG-928-E16]
MIDERLYQEYSNWLIDYDSLIKKVIDEKSPFSIRFKHVFDVVDYLYNKLIDEPEYTEEDHQIFVTGISYLSEQIYELDNVLVKFYDNDFEELEKNAKSVLLYLNIADFKNEMSILPEDERSDYSTLVNLYETVYKDYITKKAEVPNKIFENFNNVIEKIVNNLKLDYYSISDIFLEIADELGIV